jgi:hypothetical protein
MRISGIGFNESQEATFAIVDDQDQHIGSIFMTKEKAQRLVSLIYFGLLRTEPLQHGPARCMFCGKPCSCNLMTEINRA